MRKGQTDRGAAMLTLAGFMVLLLASAWLGQPPPAVALLYFGASVLTFALYAQDKAAARRGAWRTPESTLHFLALAGGWPGALVAQQLLRHKSRKAKFRAVFWATVLANVAGLLLLCSPAARRLLQA